MSYQSIDAALSSWARGHNLHLSTEYKDEPVRSLDVVSARGRKVQIWVDPPSAGRVTVHVWDYRHRQEEASGDQNELIDLLVRRIHTLEDV